MKDFLKEHFKSEDEGKELASKAEADYLLGTIMNKISEMEDRGFEPEYILVNKRNYERIVSASSNGLVDELFGLRIILWDVPIDYVNVRAKASTEYSLMGIIRERD